MARFVVAVVATFITWSVVDFVVHGVLLGPSYEATADLWRPMAEMKMGLMYGANAISALAFVTLYQVLVRPKGVRGGFVLGLLYGTAMGIPMGFGTYSVMPIPLSMAILWFVGALVQTSAAGLLVGLILPARPSDSRTAT